MCSSSMDSFDVPFRIDSVTGRVCNREHNDPMKDWPEERKMVEAEQLANAIERGIRYDDACVKIMS
jgi:hypothetical protein